jgi:hypothetical protein
VDNTQLESIDAVIHAINENVNTQMKPQELHFGSPCEEQYKQET